MLANFLTNEVIKKVHILPVWAWHPTPPGVYTPLNMPLLHFHDNMKYILKNVFAFYYYYSPRLSSVINKPRGDESQAHTLSLSCVYRMPSSVPPWSGLARAHTHTHTEDLLLKRDTAGWMLVNTNKPSFAHLNTVHCQHNTYRVQANNPHLS